LWAGQYPSLIRSPAQGHSPSGATLTPRVLKLVAYCCGGGRESMHIDRRVAIAAFGDALPAAHSPARRTQGPKESRTCAPRSRRRPDRPRQQNAFADRSPARYGDASPVAPPRQAPSQARRPQSSASAIPVRTYPEHNTLTPTEKPTIFVILKSSSLRATTALARPYIGPDPGSRPTMLAVFNDGPHPDWQEADTLGSGGPHQSVDAQNTTPTRLRSFTAIMPCVLAEWSIAIPQS
jgi:hypothetical protein